MKWSDFSLFSFKCERPRNDQETTKKRPRNDQGTIKERCRTKREQTEWTLRLPCTTGSRPSRISLTRRPSTSRRSAWSWEHSSWHSSRPGSSRWKWPIERRSHPSSSSGPFSFPGIPWRLALYHVKRSRSSCSCIRRKYAGPSSSQPMKSGIRISLISTDEGSIDWLIDLSETNFFDSVSHWLIDWACFANTKRPLIFNLFSTSPLTDHAVLRVAPFVRSRGHNKPTAGPDRSAPECVVHIRVSRPCDASLPPRKTLCNPPSPGQTFWSKKEKDLDKFEKFLGKKREKPHTDRSVFVNLSQSVSSWASCRCISFHRWISRRPKSFVSVVRSIQRIASRTVWFFLPRSKSSKTEN